MVMLTFAPQVQNINVGKYFNLRVRGKNAYYSEAYSEHFQTSKMERFEKIVEGFESLTIFGKSSILDVW